MLIDIIIKAFSTYASFLPFLLGLVTWRRNARSVRFLVLLSVVACTTEMISALLAYQRIPNLFLFHFYPPVELVFILVIYGIELRESISGWVFRAIGICFVGYSILNTILWQPLQVFNTNGRGVESLLLVILSVIYTTLQLKRDHGLKSGEAMFWVNTAVLLYFSLNLVFFFMSNYLNEHFSQQFTSYIWNFHAGLSFVRYLFFTIAIYIDWKSNRSPVLS